MGSSSYNWVVGLLLFLIIFLEMSAVTFGDDHSLEESKVGYNNGCRYGRRGCAGRGVHSPGNGRCECWRNGRRIWYGHWYRSWSWRWRWSRCWNRDRVWWWWW
ncbi:hypothetical protein AABB24_012892 [Solanum stoloniferum]|uniref:Glycine-rich protein n=1 Tax=Solanum stoloniferum TaxID=62892 RepID=A0ABD2U8G0_9SOLN